MTPGTAGLPETPALPRLPGIPGIPGHREPGKPAEGPAGDPRGGQTGGSGLEGWGAPGVMELLLLPSPRLGWEGSRPAVMGLSWLGVPAWWEPRVSLPSVPAAPGDPGVAAVARGMSRPLSRWGLLPSGLAALGGS